MEIVSLQGSAAVPGQSPAMTDRNEGSGASAFAALVEGMQSVVTVEEDAAPEGSDEDIDETQDPEHPVELDAVSEIPFLASPLLDAVISPMEEEAQVVTLKAGRAAPRVVTGGGVDVVLSSATRGSAGQEVVALDSMEMAAAAQSGSGESTATEETSPAAAAVAHESTVKQPMPALYADSPPQQEVESPAHARASQSEAPTADRRGDMPDMTASFDLPDLTAVAISVHEGKAAAALPEADGSMRAQFHVEPRHVLRQFGEKLSECAEGVVEIALSPEELGKVRLMIAPGEKPAVTVFADRPETFDLLRRNAEALDKELRNAGIFGADISFSGGNEGRDRSSGAARDLRGFNQCDEAMSFAEPAVPARPRPIVDRRIDIRI